MFQADNAPAGLKSLLRRLSPGPRKHCAHTSEIEPELNSTSLDQVRSGQSFLISWVKEGKGLCCKLYGMGLVPGTCLTVQQNSGHGPVVVCIQGSRIGLGRGMARHIWGQADNEVNPAHR